MKQYFVPFKELRSLTRGEKFAVLSLIPLYFIVIGLFLQPINEIIPGIIRIVREPDVLITDYFAVGGIGAALINAGLTTLLSIALLYFSGKEMDGHTITSSCLMFGFSLFGKNIVNIWAIMAGVVLYAKYHRSVWHQSFPYYDTDDAYWKISYAGLSYAVPACGTGYRLCTAAFVYPCALRPSGIFSVQRRFWRRYYCNGSGFTCKIFWH